MLHKVKTLWMALLIPISIIAGESDLKLQPLSERVTEVTKANPDPTEIAYFGTRCGMLYIAIIGYLENDGERTAATRKKLQAAAETFLVIGEVFDTGINKKSAENVQAQRKLLLQYYMDEIKRGKLLNNSMFTPLIEGDFDCSKKVFPLFQAIEKTLKEK